MSMLDDIDELFRYSHLPDELQAISKPFYELAHKIAEDKSFDNDTQRDMRHEAIRDLWAVKNRMVWIAADRKR